MERKEMDRCLSSEEFHSDDTLNWQISMLKRESFKFISRDSPAINSPVHDGDEANDREEEEDVRVDFRVKFEMSLRQLGTGPVIRFCREDENQVCESWNNLIERLKHLTFGGSARLRGQ